VGHCPRWPRCNRQPWRRWPLPLTTPDVGRAQQIINDMHVSYVYIGKLERTVYPSEGIGKFEQMAEQGLLTVVYSNEEVTIHQVGG
jgi:uncharacterized membrane protein